MISQNHEKICCVIFYTSSHYRGLDEKETSTKPPVPNDCEDDGIFGKWIGEHEV